MTNEQMARAFNEWMRRFVEEPHRLESGFQMVNTFLADEANGKEPSYGEVCTAYMQKLAAESVA